MNNKFANFGYVEFEEIAGVYTCLRCLQGYKLLDKALFIKAKSEVEKFHENWK